MKQAISLILAILLIAACFAGCSLYTSAAGTYTLQTIDGVSAKDYYMPKLSQGSIEPERMLKVLGIDLDRPEDLMSMTLKEDGTYEYKSKLDFKSEKGSGEWKQDGGTVSFTLDGAIQSIEYVNGKLHLKINYGGPNMTVILEKSQE